MFNVTRQVQGSGVNYVDPVYSKYKMLARRIKRGSSTFGATDQPEFNYCNILHDNDGNIYIVTGAGSSVTTPATHGVTVTKYNSSNHDFGSFSWSKFFGNMGHDLYIRDAAVSNFGHVAIVGERTDADDAFVMVVNTSGTLEIYDEWSPNTGSRDMYATSCWWWSDGLQTSADDLSLAVICHNNWYAYGGNPWSSPILLRYGFGNSTNYISARNSSMNVSANGYYKIMGNNLANWSPLARPFRNQPIPDEAATGDGGYFQMFCEYGANTTETRYKYSLTSHYPYGNNYARSGQSYANIQKPGDSSYKIYQSSSNRGRALLQDFRPAYEGFNYYNYSFYNVMTVTSSGTYDYGSFMLVKQTASGQLHWVKTWTGYGSSTYFGNKENSAVQDYARTMNIVVPHQDRKSPYTYAWPSSDEGIYVSYRSAINTVTVLQFDKNGNVLQSANFTINSSYAIQGHSLGTDGKGNVFVNLKSSVSTSNSMGTWRHIKVPPFNHWNIPSSQTLSVDSGTTDDDVTISQGTMPTIQDQIANVQSLTVTAFSYGNPGADYVRYRLENTTQGCNSSGDLCISNTDTTASPHRTSQEVSD